MKHLQGFYEQTNEAKITKTDTTNVKFNVGSDIQIVDENDKNIGTALIKKALKSSYNVMYKAKSYTVSKAALSLNIHGQVQTELKNLK